MDIPLGSLKAFADPALDFADVFFLFAAFEFFVVFAAGRPRLFARLAALRSFAVCVADFFLARVPLLTVFFTDVRPLTLFGFFFFFFAESFFFGVFFFDCAAFFF